MPKESSFLLEHKWYFSIRYLQKQGENNNNNIIDTVACLWHKVWFGERCLSGGVLGPEGGRRYLGQWCKRGLSKLPSSGENGDLIAVESDGRGGKIKVLRSQNLFRRLHFCTIIRLVGKCNMLDWIIGWQNILKEISNIV